MIDPRDKVLNCNCQNLLHAKSHGKDVYRIQPDKFTFLKSNLLVSNIINKSICKQKKMNSTNQIDTNDAYVNCETELQKLEEENSIKKSKIERVRTLAKCRSQITFEELAAEKKNVNQKIQNVYLMRKEMVEKAAEIMGRKEDNSYLGRNLIMQKEGFLKELKETNPTQKTQKSQTVRLVMKENSKKCNIKEFKQFLEDSANGSLTRQYNSNMTLNSTMMEASVLDTSNNNAVQMKVHNDEVLKKLLKCKSTEAFMQEQKRRAVWNGFSEHWRKGCEKHEDTNKTLKKKVSKKPTRARFQTTDHEILNYHDQYTKLVALKKYENAFADTASSFKLKINNQPVA